MAYLLAFGVSLGLTLVLEFFFKPVPIFFLKRKRQSLLITGGVILSLFLFALLFTQRLYFSASLSVLGFIVVLVINNTKFKTLREPLVFSDFFLYLQAIKYPRLYLPFLGILPLVGLTLSVLLIAFLGFYFEPAKYRLVSWSTVSIATLFSLTVIAIRLLAKRVLLTGEVLVDCHNLGVLATLCCYGVQVVDQRKKLVNAIQRSSPYGSRDKVPAVASSVGLVDIVIVQSESFFDARVLTDNIKAEVLAGYDKCLKESHCYGYLQVPAWGANTMRTEFAFLTGLESCVLGLAQFYPYQQLMGMKIPSIVSELKAQGYWCVCIHPNASSFFMRDEFFKQLGFDEFVDADEFIGAKREGPYVSDIEVSGKIEKVLGQTQQPCFVFAITMENHGPLHLESVSEQEWQTYYDQEPESELTDLTVYLRHLKNADEMIRKQLEFYKKRRRSTVFAFYGDHVPAISKVFETLDYEDSRSNYFIWSSSQTGVKKAVTVSVESLGQTVLEVAKSLSK